MRTLTTVVMGLTTAAVMAGNLVRPNLWGIHPKTYKGTFNGGVYSIKVEPGKEGTPCIAFYLSNVWKRVPANTPVRAAFWSRTIQGAIPPGKNSKLGFYGHLSRANGKNSYPSVYIPRNADWKFYEYVYKDTEDLVKFNSAYLTAENFSGEIQYADVYFGVWDAAAQLEESRPEIAVSSNPVELRDFYAVASNDKILSPHKIPANATSVKLRCDSSKLYVDFICSSEFLDPVRQRLADFKAKAVKDGMGVFLDDSVEFFIECADHSILQLACNANGARFTGKKGNAIVAQWTVKAAKKDGYWTAMLEIPWSTLGYKGIPKTRPLFSAARNDQAAMQSDTFCELNNDFHDQDCFGRLSFGKKSCSLSFNPAIPTEAMPGDLRLNVTANADCTLILEYFDQKKNGKMMRVPVQKGKSADLTASLAPGGIYRMRVTAIADNGTILYRTPWRRVACTVSMTGRVTSGSIVLSGKQIKTGGTVFFQKGLNEVTSEGESSEIALQTPFAPEPEKITVKGKHLIAVGEVHPMDHLDVEHGLFIEKGGAQHLPLIFSRNANGKKLELLLPKGVKIVGQKAVPTQELKKGKFSYVQSVWPVANQKVDTWIKKGYHVFPIVLKISADAADSLPPIYYRAFGEGYTECWNTLPLKILPAIKAPKVKKIPLRIECAFGVGLIDAEGAKAIIKSLADCGFNMYYERRAHMDNYEWYDAGRAAGLVICGELNIKNMRLWGIMDVLTKHGGHCPAPIHVMMGSQKEQIRKALKKYIGHCHHEMLDFDLEFPTGSEFDASLESRKRFAEWAKLPKIPEKADLLGKLRPEWDNFCAKEMADFCRMLRDIVKEIKPDCKFCVYSSYPGPNNKRLYGIDWTLFPGIADYAAVGYGRPSEKTTQELRRQIPGIPVMCGILTDTMKHSAMCNLANESLWRLTMGYEALLYFEWSSFDGLARSQIARLAEILAKYESRIPGSKRNADFTVSGNLLKHECVVLEKDGSKLLLAFNFGVAERKGTVRIDGKDIPVVVPPHDCTPAFVK